MLSHVSLVGEQSIGSRPLLSLGVLLVLIGGQIVLTGLLADLILRVTPMPDATFR